jgi:hypothetical protein
MLKKRGKFLTFVFSMLPGAGHMFMGFMKLGISFMAIFFLVIFVSTWLNFGALMILVPLIWFYAFFDCINKSYSTNEEFEKFKDEYLYSPEVLKGLLKNRNGFIVGFLLILFGFYIFLNNILEYLSRFLPDKLYSQIYFVFRSSPQLLVGAVIIIAGIWLILGKKGSDNN